MTDKTFEITPSDEEKHHIWSEKKESGAHRSVFVVQEGTDDLAVPQQDGSSQARVPFAPLILVVTQLV